MIEFKLDALTREAETFNIVLPKEGVVGKIVQLELMPDTAYLFQVPVPTKELTSDYREKARSVLKQVLPEGMQAMIIGNDVSIYQVLGEDAVALRLKGLV